MQKTSERAPVRENVVVHEQRRLDSLGRSPHAHAICHLSLQGTEGSKSIGSSTQHSACSLEGAPACPLRAGRPASQASQAALGAKGTAGHAAAGRGAGVGGGHREVNSVLLAIITAAQRAPPLLVLFLFLS